MPLPEGLLNPIPGENPSGQNLRYDPVYDRIREARREEEALSQGAWTREVKKANFIEVLKLASEVLSTKSKDLQIAAWLTEALIAQEKIPGLKQGLDLIHGLLANFWDTLYPEIEDGDLEMRAGPIEWVGSRLDVAVRKVPLTKNKFDWFQYQESRRIGYEADAAGNEAKLAARQAAIEEKKCTAEEFDEAVKLTGDTYYQALVADLATALESIQALEALCDSLFGRDAPNFSNLKTAVEDLQQAIREFWLPPEVEPQPTERAEEAVPGPNGNQGAAPTPRPQRAKKGTTEEPTSPDDAISRVFNLAGYLRRVNAGSPIPHMIVRAVRWSELRANGPPLDSALLEAPPTETRQQLKRLAAEGQWGDLLEAAETAMGLPCGRGWIDLQRHAVRACEGLGYEPVAAAVRSGLRSLLQDYPDLIAATLADDTPAANHETQAWIREAILPPPRKPEPEIEAPTVPKPSAQASGNGPAPDIHDVAIRAAKAGRVQEAIELLTREIAQERSGRARFHRKIQLATICLSTKHEAIAYPILAELSDEIDRRKLEEWEEAASLAHPLVLLYRCMDKLGQNEGAKQKIYQQICRLDPVQALSGMR